MKKIFIRTIVASVIFSSKLFAIEIGKPIVTSVAITKPNLAAAGEMTKHISLLNFQFTAKEKDFLFNYQPAKLPLHLSDELPDSVDLGMNNVPVLDQGVHGACTTFANTAIVDAILEKGDYISQLCHLQLGDYLEKYGYRLSGWEGSMGSWVLNQIMQFGIVNKTNQRNKSCGSVTEYPIDSPNNSKALPLTQFKKVSEDISNLIYPVSILSWSKRFNSKLPTAKADEFLITAVKTALAAGDRLSLGFSLVLAPKCNVGACATHHVKQDTWAVTKEIKNPRLDLEGHELVITGYDDNAEAVDNAGNIHKGLLTLRNSWSADVGDNGNFYMTYDYLEHYIVELQEIIHLED